MKRFGRGVLYLALILAVVHGISSMVLGRNLTARLQELRDKGEIVSLADFGKPRVSDADNGAPLYEKVFAAIAAGPKSSPAKTLGAFLDPTERIKRPELWSQAESVVAKYKDVFPLIEQAAAKPGCQFTADWRDGYTAVMYPQFTKMRDVTSLLCADALIQARKGNAARAAHSLALSLKASESLGDEPTLIAILVRIALVCRTCDVMQTVCRETSLGEPQMCELQTALEGIDLGPGYRHAMQGERAFGISAFDTLRGDLLELQWLTTVSDNESINKKSGRRVDGVILGWLARPFLYADEGVYLNYMDTMVSAADKPYREVAHILNVEPKCPRWAVVSSVITPWFGRAQSRRDAGTASVAGSRIYLGLLAYKAKAGVYPERLDQLQPILASPVPSDPFSGKDFVYKRRGDGFLLYSIGEDMKDNGAKVFPSKNEADARYVNSKGGRTKDIVWSSNK